jgi:hypothetical protein
MARSNTLTFERLLDWLEGRLSPPEYSEVADKVALADATVQAEVAWIRAFLQLEGKVVLEAPPSQVHQLLVQRFVDQRQKHHATVSTPEQPGFFQRLLAALTFDSQLQPALAGVRGIEDHSTRQLIYSTAVADVALDLHREAELGKITLMGQILPTDEFTLAPEATASDLAREACAVQLLQAGSEIAITQSDELGEFTFKQLLPGEYELILTTTTVDLVIPSIVVTL